VPGLSANGLTWCAGERRYGPAPDPLEVGPREVATVCVEDPVAGRALADVLTGLADPEDGVVDSGGGRVALVPPGALLPDLTVAANLALGLRAHSDADRRGRVQHAARLLEVEGALGPGRPTHGWRSAGASWRSRWATRPARARSSSATCPAGPAGTRSAG
jgi:hypothetical protein